ncbi:hypothetical protein EAH68_09865 [Corynebacterium hylobatis]|uniref:Lipase family protein n=1 Tax=Corynebacterium hylobatis TaxID=1859290 RepID=A0A3R9ZD53_9CORY|nr:hypothetical protein [Corynebacterium hylobatis]RSZ62434.1 hypothetical protein EAH68_09865 [Corynebacterium hylobatis]
MEMQREQRSQRQRQAVVLIHGIGDQRPMDTLRAFMAGIGVPEYYSKPHRYSSNYELRRFSSHGSHPRPETDFFEFYWAHHFPAGRLFATLRWLFTDLLFRRPFWGHQPPLRRPIGIFQAAVTALVLIFLTAVGGWLGFIGLPAGSAQLLSRILIIAAVVALVVVLLAGGFLTRSLADAKFYLSGAPGSLKARNEIRAEGLSLLHALHDAGTYERIVVVGHSLGSVIGLDLIRLAWDELRHPDPALAEAPDDYPTTLAANFDNLVELLPPDPDPEDLENWQQAQHALWVESRHRGMRWLITDFITLGSPLTYADFLLSRSNARFQERKTQREYPECPPIDDRGGVFYSRQYTREDGWHTLGGRSPRNALVAHHGAPFAVTRWSNAYFPRWLFFGDLVGGPLASKFGCGIRDVAVRAASLRRWSRRDIFPWVHSRYWRLDSEASVVQDLVEEELRLKKQERELTKQSEGPAEQKLQAVRRELELVREKILDNRKAIQHERGKVDEKSGTLVAYRALAEFLRLNNQKAAKHYPPPSGPRLRRPVPFTAPPE